MGIVDTPHRYATFSCFHISTELRIITDIVIFQQKYDTKYDTTLSLHDNERSGDACLFQVINTVNGVPVVLE